MDVYTRGIEMNKCFAKGCWNKSNFMAWLHGNIIFSCQEHKQLLENKIKEVGINGQIFHR